MKKHRRSNNPTKSICGRLYSTEKDLALVDNPYDVTCRRCQAIIGPIPDAAWSLVPTKEA